MKLKTILQASMMLPVLLVVSCKQNEPDPVPGKNGIRFANVKGSFAQGTEFGLYVGSPINKENVKLTVNQDGQLVPSDSLFWSLGQKSSSSFLCYTPYNSTYSGTEVSFKVKEDQSIAANLTASDLMCSVTSAAPSDEAVNFNFAHKLVTAKFYFDNRLNTQISKVVIKDINSSCTFSLTSGDVKTPTDKKDITCYNTGEYWQAVFVPQSAKLSIAITMSDGKEIVKEASSQTTFTSGYIYSTDKNPIVIEDAVAKVINFVFSVSDWTDGGQLNFNDEEEEYTTLAEIVATAGTTSKSISNVTVKNVIVTKVNAKYAHIEDATAAILVFASSHGLSEGDCINGPISGTIVLYDGNSTVSDVNKAYAEMTSIDCSKATVTSVTEDKYPLTVLTIKQYNDSPRQYFNRRIKFEKISIDTGISSTVQTGSISQGTNTLTLFNKSKAAVMETGLVGDLICFPTIHKNSLQANVYTSDEFTENGGESEDTAFTRLTAMGFYSSTDTETPVAVLTYSEGNDQFSCSKSSSARGFRMFNLSSGTYAIVDINTVSIVAGSDISASVSLNGAAKETHTVRVAKKTSTNAWLEDKTNKVGYVIAIQ